jgi:hypothetical protein
MIVMLDHSGIRTGYLAGRFPGKLGHLFSPGYQKGPHEFMPYALDNGAYARGDNWDEAGWKRMLDWAKLSGQPPRWIIVPDVVGNRDGTLDKWWKYAPVAERYGWPLAFAVQNGMTLKDVPSDASVVFVGGTLDWKWKTLEMWCERFPRVHVGRVNSYKRLWQCHDSGAESCDGTGWMRGDQVQYRGLLAYLEESTERRKRIVQLDLHATEDWPTLPLLKVQ